MACKVFIDLPGGLKMPALGYGTWQATDAELEQAVDAALEAGYRHIDTAYVYENEKVIGKVINRWITSGKLNREDLFLVTKLPPGGGRAEAVPKFLKRSLENLQVDYIDVYLVHVPFAFQDIEGDLHPITPEGLSNIDTTTDHVAIWKAMEAQVDAGLAKAIGISNFNIKQISRIIENARIPPANLQIELHAYHQQKELVEFCKKHNIVITAYSPLGSPGLGKFLAQFGQDKEVPDILGNPVIKEIAKKNGKTEAQVVLRHIIQKGIATIPKSTTAARIRQNIDIFDFVLDDKDMEALNALDKGPAARILDFTAFPGWRKIQEVGLATEYKDKDSEIGKFLSYLFGLPFLTPDEVGDCFGIDFSKIQPNNGNVTRICDYLVENYIPEDLKFPPIMWAETYGAPFVP